MKSVECQNCAELIEESSVIKVQAFMNTRVLVLIACPHCRRLDLYSICSSEYREPGLVKIEKPKAKTKPIFEALCAHQKKVDSYTDKRY